MNTEIFDTNHLKKTYFKMSLPVVIGLVVTLIYNLADTFFIGQTGNTKLVAGVSLCSPVFTILMAFGNIYGQGGSSLISRLLGKNDRDSVHYASSFCFYIAIFTGLILSIFMVLSNNWLLHVIGANQDTIKYASEYFIVLALGAPFIIVSFIHSNLLRCEGLATQSMIGTVCGTILNIILDPLFISTFHMGARGAAIATILGYLLSDIYLFIITLKKSQWLSIRIEHFHISKDEIKQILGVGLTAAITNFMQSMCIIVMNQFLLPYGSDKIAAMGIVLKINRIAQLILTGFSFGGVPLFGYLFGSQNQKKLKELIIICIKFLTISSLILTVLIFTIAPTLIKIIIDKQNIIIDGTIMLRYQVISTIFASIVLLLTCLFQAAGKVLPAFMLSISRQGILFIIILIIFRQLFGYFGLLISQIIADILSALLAIYLYKHTF